MLHQLYIVRQIIFNYSGQLYIFFDGSLQGYGACVYVRSDSQFNLLSSSAKVLGKSAFSMPQSEIAGAVLATRMEQKISQELFNLSLSRLMEIAAVTSPDNWFWCPSPLNPADLLTKTGSICDKIKSDFWLHGRFLPQPESSWPIKKCVSLPANNHLSRTINLKIEVLVNPSSDLVVSLLEHNQSDHRLNLYP